MFLKSSFAKNLFWKSIPILLGVVIAFGVLRAFHTGAKDLAVFHFAWQKVLAGQGLEVYRDSPDRFLYAPGFAWLFSGLGWIPFQVAILLWCLLKAGLLAWMIRVLGQAFRLKSFPVKSVVALGVICAARPLLIDFQYGQVNFVIVFCCLWALLGHFGVLDRGQADSVRWDFVRWMTLAIAAVTKLFALPLLLVPLLARTGVTARKTRMELAGIATGLLLITFAPLFALHSVNWDELIRLYQEWGSALVRRGFPTESHNQSFGAFVHRFFTDHAVQVKSLGWMPIEFGWDILSLEAVRWIKLVWSVFWAGAILFWMTRTQSRDLLTWTAILVGLLIVPSHLVWKPYFVFSMPLFIVGLFYGFQAYEKTGSWKRLMPVLFAAALINFTSYSFLGRYPSALFEVSSCFLWAHFILMVSNFRVKKQLN